MSATCGHTSQTAFPTYGEIYTSRPSHEPNLARFRHGTFEYLCDMYSQLIYAGGSNVPRSLEFGVLKNDETLWVEVFDD
jgi:hypothetical protein